MNEKQKDAEVSRINREIIGLESKLKELLRAREALVGVTTLDVAVRQLFEDAAKNYQTYDIVAGWNLKPGTDEANTALTALDVVIQDLLEKAITG